MAEPPGQSLFTGPPQFKDQTGDRARQRSSSTNTPLPEGGTFESQIPFVSGIPVDSSSVAQHIQPTTPGTAAPPTNRFHEDAATSRRWASKRNLGLVCALLVLLIGAAIGATIGLRSRQSQPGEDETNTMMFPPTTAQPITIPRPPLSGTPSSSPTMFWKTEGQALFGENFLDQYGAAVALSDDGRTLAVGSANADGLGQSDNGKLEVYELSGDNTWIQRGQSIYGDESGDHLGIAVSISDDGNFVAVSSTRSVALVRIYRFMNSNWIQEGQDLVGNSVQLSVDGSIVAVGAPEADNNGTISGMVSVYQLEENAWVTLGSNLLGSAEGAEFGFSLALSGTTTVLAVGSIGSSSVQVFQFDGSDWVQSGIITGLHEGDRFGRSVAISDDGLTIAVGAEGARGFNDQFFAGEVRVFRLFGDDSWRPLGQSITGSGRLDAFGVSIALSKDGRTLVVGATQQFAPGEPAGFARVYALSDEFVWEPVGEDLNGMYANDDFGYAVAIAREGAAVAVGAPQFLSEGDSVPTENTGYVQVYASS